MKCQKINNIEEIDLDVLKSSLVQQKEMMHKMNNYQWSDNYPLLKDFQNDIDNQVLYGFYSEDVLIGIAALTENYESHYYELENNFEFSKEEDHILYIHRLIKLNSHGFTNIGPKMLKSIIEKMISNYDAIQIDTNEANIPMQKSIERAGFTKVGYFIRKGAINPKWHCYEIVKGE